MHAKHRSSGDEVAIKILDKSKVTLSCVSSFKNETAFLKLLKHDNVINIIEVFEDAGISYLVTNYYQAGDLHTYMTNQKHQTLDEESVKRLGRKIVEGLAYLHSQRIVHRDIKPENILISNNETEPIIADFGYSLRLSEGETCTRWCGT